MKSGRYRYGSRLVVVKANEALPLVHGYGTANKHLPKAPKALRAVLRAAGWNPHFDPHPAVQAIRDHDAGDPWALVRYAQTLSDGLGTVAAPDQGA